MSDVDVIRAKMADRPDYRESVDGWMRFLRKRHRGRETWPLPPHRAAEHAGSCAPCDALRLLRAAGTPPKA